MVCMNEKFEDTDFSLRPHPFCPVPIDDAVRFSATAKMPTLPEVLNLRRKNWTHGQ